MCVLGAVRDVLSSRHYPLHVPVCAGSLAVFPPVEACIGNGPYGCLVVAAEGD